MKKAYPLFGITAPLAYVLAVIIGGFLIQDYSHIYNSISELTASNVPKVPIIFILFAIYNISLTLFGIGLYSNLSIASPVKVKIASFMLAVIGVLGLAMLYYVQDPRDAAMSFNGKMHLILAIPSSLLTMVSIVLYGFSFKKDTSLKWYALYSFISFGVIFVTGGIAGISVANNAPYGGLFERLTIGAFMQWVFVIAVKLHKQERNKTIVLKKFNSI